MNKKMNMQMSKNGNQIKPLRELNLLDDFLFDAATVDLETCRIILELSLGFPVRSIRWKEGQKVIHNLPGKRGIRMDFYVEDADGKIYDVEMQKRNYGNIPKRTRFYQALQDAPLLERGEEGFDNLNPLYIIVICGFDLFGKGKYRYTFQNLCKEDMDLELGDESTKIFLNTKGKNDKETEQSLIDFLHYIEKSSEENLPENCDERLKHLHKTVQRIKASEQMEVSYMKMEERDRLIRKEGLEAGLETGRLQGLIEACMEFGLSRDKIVEKVCEKFSFSREEAEESVENFWKE